MEKKKYDIWDSMIPLWAHIGLIAGMLLSSFTQNLWSVASGVGCGIIAGIINDIYNFQKQKAPR